MVESDYMILWRFCTLKGERSPAEKPTPPAKEKGPFITKESPSIEKNMGDSDSDQQIPVAEVEFPLSNEIKGTKTGEAFVFESEDQKVTNTNELDCNDTLDEDDHVYAKKDHFEKGDQGLKNNEGDKDVIESGSYVSDRTDQRGKELNNIEKAETLKCCQNLENDEDKLVNVKMKNEPKRMKKKLVSTIVENTVEDSGVAKSEEKLPDGNPENSVASSNPTAAAALPPPTTLKTQISGQTTGRQTNLLISTTTSERSKNSALNPTAKSFNPKAVAFKPRTPSASTTTTENTTPSTPAANANNSAVNLANPMQQNNATLTDNMQNTVSALNPTISASDITLPNTTKPKDMDNDEDVDLISPVVESKHRNDLVLKNFCDTISKCLADNWTDDGNNKLKTELELDDSSSESDWYSIDEDDGKLVIRCYEESVPKIKKKFYL